MAQGTGSDSNNTIVSLASTGEVFATLTGIETSAIAATDFVTI